MGEMKRAEARYRAERTMEQEAERRAQGVIVIAASIIAGIRLARDSNISTGSRRVTSVVSDSIALARRIMVTVLRSGAE